MRVDALYEFLLLSSNLSFTETAKSFFVSQSVLSSHISGLEKELGVRLFVRDRHSVRLTGAGSLFLEDARKIVEDYEMALGRIAHYQEGITAEVTVGFLLGSFGSFLPLVCNSFSSGHHNVEFGFRELGISEMQDALNQNLIDIGFTLFSEEVKFSRYEHCCLYQDRYKLAVPKTHRLADRKSIALGDLKNETVLAARFNSSKSTLTQTSVWLRNAGVNVKSDDRIVDAPSLMATVVATGRVAMALDHLDVYGNGNIVFIPIEGEGMNLCAGPLWKKSKENDAIVSFIGYLKRVTRRFVREDFLSRKGADTLPFSWD